MKENITVYSNGCPKCKVLEAKLNAKGIKFDISRDMSKVSEQGINSLPVMAVNGEWMNFVESNNWVNAQ